MIKTWLSQNFGIKYPIILAPMFLVSNKKMLLEAARSGIMACIPALNFRSIDELKATMLSLKHEIEGPYGINLIVNKSNIYFQQQLLACQEIEPDFIITSLGSPGSTIAAFKNTKTKIFCDVTDLEYAKKVENLGADALIAVNAGAGGHAGKLPITVLVPQLVKNCKIPVISAGGLGSGEGLLSALSLGAVGVSMGSPFIASRESSVSDEYKKACINFGAKDIVLSSKISGTPCTVINTPYVKKIGTEQNWIEKILSRNKFLKKYVKLFTWYFGTKAIERAAFSATYKTVWCAGPSIEFCNQQLAIREIVERIKYEYDAAFEKVLGLRNQ